VLGHKRCRRIFNASVRALLPEDFRPYDKWEYTFSEYKNHHTAKFLASIEPSGGYGFVSDAYAGEIGDGDLTRIYGLPQDLVESGDASLADRGFLMKHEAAVRRKANRAASPAQKLELERTEIYFTEEESKYTSDIARLRIPIERAFA
jgi:hypothetical protein